MDVLVTEIFSDLLALINLGSQTTGFSKAYLIAEIQFFSLVLKSPDSLRATGHWPKDLR